MKLNEIKLLNENTFPTDKNEIEKILNKLGIKNYTIHPNGVVDVDGHVNLSHRNLNKIPVQFGIITEYFSCYSNKLTSLQGCPTSVYGDFNCYSNKLTTLEGCPTRINGDFICSYNQLTTLDGCPTSVGGNFDCTDNQLTSLIGCPSSVGEYFSCSDNQLTTLEGCPSALNIIKCSSNKLTTLEGIADIITSMERFHCFNEISSGGLGLVLINGLKFVDVDFKDRKVSNIIQRYLGRPDDIFECQNELIEAGLEEYAKL